MALIGRISQLLVADLHAVLDRIEEPEALLKQAVREMEGELAKGEQRIKCLTLENEQLDASAARIEQALGRLGEELDLCFAAGKDELARNLVRRRLEHERHAQALAARRKALAKSIAEARTALAERHTLLEDLRRRAELVSAESGREAPFDPPAGAELSVSDDEVEVAFLREREHRRSS